MSKGESNGPSRQLTNDETKRPAPMNTVQAFDMFEAQNTG
ncbi:hypothetical protein SCH4B_2152 [Ruegeria sp. TrichCH4B]|nr:hypothetical protein SCH4B_2152 [Ruegeria sp. TrichCH4B]